MTDPQARHGGGYTPPLGGFPPNRSFTADNASFSSRNSSNQGPAYFTNTPQQNPYYRPAVAHGGSYTPPQVVPSQGMAQAQQAPQAIQSFAHGGKSATMPATLREDPGLHQAESVSPAQSPYGMPQEKGFQSHDEEIEDEGYGTRKPDQEYKPKRMPQQGYHHLHRSSNNWRWRFPHAYRRPGFKYRTDKEYFHRDRLRRKLEKKEDDRYLNPSNGRLSKLIVQCTDELYGKTNTTWSRTFIRNWGSPLIRVANWPTKTLPSNTKEWSTEEWLVVVGKWLPACLALFFLMPAPITVVASTKNNGYYDAFDYRYWGYSKVARNQLESDGSKGLTFRKEQSPNPEVEALLRPRYLCFLNDPTGSDMCGAVPMKVDDWIAEHGTEENMEYLFIGYTAKQFSHSSDSDMLALSKLAEKATRDAGLPAYWIACSCMRDNELETDVFRISDVIRGAHSLAIVVGHPVNRRTERVTTAEMLQEWGSRMWTLPEALLSPKGRPISVYTRGLDDEQPWSISKSNFSSIAWADAPVVKQLMDHYEGSIILSRLELVIIALRCLHSRQTSQYFKGDLSYALMGLLRRRPRVDSEDSEFQAFARLSLANDSDMLLERLACVLPRDEHQPWLSADDAWNASLWDIYPYSQVAGVGPEDTVLIDGAFGASIQWKSFATVLTSGRDTMTRQAARLILRITPFFFLTACLMAALGTSNGIAALFFILSLPAIILSPWLMRIVYGGKVWSAQPWLFGFEGYLDLTTLEENIFGRCSGHLTWSATGSPLSRHKRNEYGECVGIDPTSDPAVRALVDRAKDAMVPGDQRIFTLVDTNVMTVTLFAAVRPPIAAILCASEGGMQRAVMCSYEWRTQTLYRETVLRMETPVLGKMARVPRFRFGFQRRAPDAEEVA